jgi:hypothetical protein
VVRACCSPCEPGGAEVVVPLLAGQVPAGEGTGGAYPVVGVERVGDRSVGRADGEELPVGCEPDMCGDRLGERLAERFARGDVAQAGGAVDGGESARSPGWWTPTVSARPA